MSTLKAFMDKFPGEAVKKFARQGASLDRAIAGQGALFECTRIDLLRTPDKLSGTSKEKRYTLSPNSVRIASDGYRTFLEA